MKTTNTATANPPSSATPELGDAGALQPLQRDAAEQREGGVGDQVIEQVGAARPAAQRVGAGGGEAEQDGGRRAEQGAGQHDAEERAADAEALGVEHDEVAAEHEHEQQPDHRGRLPLLLRGEQRGAGDHGRQQHRLEDHREPAAAGAQRRRGATRLLPRIAAAPALGGAGRPHQRERPGDDQQPQDDCQPDNH
jgi:hypothetical protein